MPRTVSGRTDRSSVWGKTVGDAALAGWFWGRGTAKAVVLFVTRLARLDALD